MCINQHAPATELSDLAIKRFQQKCAGNAAEWHHNRRHHKNNDERCVGSSGRGYNAKCPMVATAFKPSAKDSCRVTFEEKNMSVTRDK
jgi:hypothetical protein